MDEEFIADTDTPRTAADLAALFDQFTKPTERENVPLTFDPDDYPLF